MDVIGAEVDDGRVSLTVLPTIGFTNGTAVGECFGDPFNIISPG